MSLSGLPILRCHYNCNDLFAHTFCLLCTYQVTCSFNCSVLSIGCHLKIKWYWIESQSKLQVKPQEKNLWILSIISLIETISSFVNTVDVCLIFKELIVSVRKCEKEFSRIQKRNMEMLKHSSCRLLLLFDLPTRWPLSNSG